MVGKYKAYPEYKDSGVEWLGYIPEHWKINKLGYIGEMRNGLTYSPDDITNDGQGILVLRSSNIQNGKLCFDDNVYVNKKIPEKLYTKENDILICSRNGSRNLIGKNALIPYEYEKYSYGAFMLIYRSSYNLYLSWVFNSILFIHQSSSFLTTTINQLTVDNLKNFEIPIPSVKEQKEIINFLTYETFKIDTLIEKQQQLIKLLEEKRQAVISHAVTKGLNPNVSMKDSGVEWLGEIPEYWEIYRLKTITTLKTSKSCFKNNLIALENIESWSGKYVKTENDYSGDGIAFKAGDILFGKLRPYLAKVYIAESDGEAIGDFFVLRTKPKVISRFLQLCLLTQEVIFIINGSTFGAKMPRVSWEFMGNLSFVIPPLKEQEEIISYLKAEISKLDLLIEKANQTIILLKERRTALISAAVTGKIDVRDWQAPTITV